MANLCKLFQEAESQFKLQLRLSEKETQEILRYGGKGVAWRRMDRDVIQLCPTTKGREPFRDGDYIVVTKDKEKECRYRDPQIKLKETWSYLGCDCTNLSDEQVLEWIETAYKYRKG